MGTLVFVFAAVSLASASKLDVPRSQIEIGSISKLQHEDSDVGWLGSIQREYSSRRLASCFKEFDFTCVRAKLYSNLNKMLQKKSFKLFDNVIVESMPVNSTEELGRAWSGQVNYYETPRSQDEANQRLDQLLIAGVSKMLLGRSAKVDFPSGLRVKLSTGPTENGLLSFDVGAGRAMAEGKC